MGPCSKGTTATGMVTIGPASGRTASREGAAPRLASQMSVSTGSTRLISRICHGCAR